MSSRLRSRLADWFLALFLLPTALLMLMPFVWMVSTALKSSGAVFEYPPTFIPDPIRWDNFVRLFEVLPFARFFLNSVFVASTVTVLHLATSSAAAYAFARLKFPGRNILFLGYLGTLMIPAQVVIIPNFILLRYLGWIDTYQALILPSAFNAFGTFLLRQYFLTIPFELEDAAVMDGASHFQIYSRIILPLSGPALAALAIFTFLFNWNSFLYPLIVTNSVEMSTLTVGLNTLRGQYTTAWTLLMAGSAIAIVPVLTVFMLAQRYFIKGITMTGIGGR